MFPELFRIPLFPLAKVGWAVFIILIVVVAGLVQYLGPRAEKLPKLQKHLLLSGPVVLLVGAFVLFVEHERFGRLPINSYGFSIMVGFLLASWVAVRRGKPLGFNGDFILDVGILAMIFGIIGAKINYLIQFGDTMELSDTKPGLFSDSGLNPLGALLLGPIPYAFWWWRTAKPAAPGEPARPVVRLWSWQNAVLLVMTLFLSLLGTRALFLYHHSSEYSWKLFENWQRGFVLYGGLIAGVAAGALYVKMRGESIARVADLVAAPIMLALAFGRFGCFLNGCCYGKPGPAGFPRLRFPSGSPAAGRRGEESLPVHPTQLYEVVAALVFFFVLSALWKKKRKADGELFLIMVLLYGAWRFCIEFARGDERGGSWAGLSYSQCISLAAMGVAGVWLYLLRHRPATPPPAPAEAAPPPAPAA